MTSSHSPSTGWRQARPRRAVSTAADTATTAQALTGEVPHPGWLLHEHAILRSTGFAFDLLDLLEFPQTADIIEQVVTAEDQVTSAVGAVVAAAREVPRPALPPSVAKAVRKALARRGPVRSDLMVPDLLAAPLREYARALAHRDDLLAQAQRQAGQEAADNHDALVRLTGTDQRVVEALWASSPGMYDTGLRELRATAANPGTGRARVLRRQVAGYLQRLCAKNETTSFFGPIEYADYGQPAAGPLRTGPVRDRRPRVASWVVIALADRISADDTVRALLPVRKAPSVSLRDGMVQAAGRFLAVEQRYVRLLELLDGTLNCHDLARRLDEPITDTLFAVDALRRRRLVIADLRPPVTEIDALGCLCSALAGLPAANARVMLNRLREIESELARVPFERKPVLMAEAESLVADFAGVSARRGGGEWYADRAVIREECVGPLTPLHLGDRVREQLRTELAPAFDFLAGEALARHRALTAAVLDRVPGLRTGRPMPLLDFLHHQPGRTVR